MTISPKPNLSVPMKASGGSFASIIRASEPTAPNGTFAEGNEITITSADAGFTFGSKPQAAPMFYWHGRDVWVNGVSRDDYSAVSSGDPVPATASDVFTSSSGSDPSFSGDARTASHGISIAIKPGYFGKPAGYSPSVSWSSSFASWRAKLPDGAVNFVAYGYTSTTGTFIEGEPVRLETLSNGTFNTTGTFRSLRADNTTIQLTEGFSGTSSASRDGGTIYGETSGATAVIDTRVSGLLNSKITRIDYEGGEHDRIANTVTGNRSFIINRYFDGETAAETRYFEQGPDGADAGYHAFSWGNGDWELHENSMILTGAEGYHFHAISELGRQYSNQIDTSLVSFADRFPNLITLGSDGTGGGSDIDVEILLSDVYFDSSAQRVFVSNSATYSSAVKSIELQLPTAWSDTEVTFRAIEGALDASSPVYAYIVDNNGLVNGVDVLAYNSALSADGILING